jgi:imidazolonepropionase-like amidohydrolase
VPTLTTFHDLAQRFDAKFAPVLVEQAKRQLEDARRTLLAADRLGVPMAMGHDSGPPGDDAVELLHMVEAGLTPMKAIVAATAGSARALGFEDYGTIRPGGVADLMVVDGNPLDDIGILRQRARVWLVVKDGRPVAGRALDARGLEAVESGGEAV